jgi:hypothetical protein
VLNAVFEPQPGFEADQFSGLNVLETTSSPFPDVRAHSFDTMLLPSITIKLAPTAGLFIRRSGLEGHQAHRSDKAEPQHDRPLIVLTLLSVTPVPSTSPVP